MNILDKPFLPSRLSISEAIPELTLDDMPHTNAVRRLLQYTQDGLKIYFAAGLFGYPSDMPRATHTDPDRFTLLETVDEGDTVLVESEDGEIRLVSGVCVERNEEPPDIEVYEFTQNGVDYVSVNPNAALIVPTTVIEARFYIYRDDLLDFINSMSGRDQDQNAEKEDQSSTRISGELKALAIIAAEFAADREKYRTGNKVNASAFKDHVVNKAHEYDIPDHGLKKLDDKINKALIYLDIKDVREKS